MGSTHAYIGVWDDTAKMARADDPDAKRDVQKFVSEVIKKGGTLHRVPAQWVREHFDEAGAAKDL